MHKIRLRFSKSGALKFIGHLDFLRAFQQTVRRAGLPAAFSQGFNPHLLISFALPLPLGMESANDYADLTLENEMPCDEIVEKLNAAAPAGLVVKAAYPAENKAASVVSVADYAVDLANSGEFDRAKILHAIEQIKQSKSIVIPKKTKKGIKDTEIRPDIYAIEMLQGESRLLMRLSAGSARFLHPITVAEIICGETAKPSAAAFSRRELYYENESGELITL
jgi:radical SAM-linked protein